MTSVFHKILRAVAGAMEIPDVVFLVLALGFAVFSVGWLICEYFTEHRHMREDLPRLLDALREQGAVMAQMTGSGAAVFGIFDDENAARSAVAALKNGYKQVYLCKPTHGGPRVTVRRLFGAKK